MNAGSLLVHAGRRRLRALVILAVIAALMGSSLTVGSNEARGDEPIDDRIDLMLLLDGSGSISAADWRLQLDGYRAALEDPRLLPRDGSVALGVLQWSSGSVEGPTRLEIPLREIADDDSVQTLLTQLGQIVQIGNLTNPGDGIRASTDHLLEAGREGAAGYLCMSTDGVTNSGESLASATAHARSSGVARYSVIGIADTSFSEATAQSHYGPHVFGGGTVTFARNATEFATLVGGCINDPLELAAVEVNQSVQDWNNSIPLVANKPTIARAFVQAPGDEEVVTTGRLRGFRNGVELADSPLASMNPGGISVTDDAVADRARADGSLNFALPPAWRSGTVVLRVELPAGQFCGDGLRVAGGCGVTVDFEGTEPSRVRYLAASWEEDGQRLAATNLDVVEQSERLLTMLPVADYEFEYGELALGKRPGSWIVLNSRLHAARILDGRGGTEWRYHASLPGVRPEGQTYSGYASLAASSAYLQNAEAKAAGGRFRNLGVHELGHSYGLDHVVNADRFGRTFFGLKRGSCNEEAQPLAPDYPHYLDLDDGRTVSTIGPMGDPATEIWGVDARFFGANDSLGIIAPHRDVPLMSYCRPVDGEDRQGRWISEVNYRKLFADRFGGTVVASVPASTGGLVVRGTVDLDTGDVVLLPAIASSDVSPAPDDPAGDLELRVRDESGTLVHSVRVAGLEVDGDRDPETEVEPSLGDQVFTVAIPSPGEAAFSLEVVRDDEVVARGLPSPNAPRIAAFAPGPGDLTDDGVRFSWGSSDADGDEVFHTLQYSTDGLDWRTLGVDLTGEEVTIARWSLPGSEQARIRVIASDGLRTDVSESAPFSLPDLAPVVAIRRPFEGERFFGVQTIALQAYADDAEDGRLDGASVRWRSDLDGQLAVGAEASVRADQLSEGEHLITVTATDSAGRASSDAVSIQVARFAQPPRPDLTYSFGGFRAPVAGDGTVNRHAAGRLLPVKFDVSGGDGNVDPVRQVSFDADGATYATVRSADTYHVNVMVPAAWAGTRRVLTVELADGGRYDAVFDFR
jgi:hypothetical protein